MAAPIKIIDLFAGPGGLGEGFSSLTDENGKPIFRIALSIEKEKSAHKTLTLRAFFRQFSPQNIPAEYYEYLHGRLGNDPFEQLFNVPHLKKFAERACTEARCLTLGEDNDKINTAIEAALGEKNEPWVLIGGPPCQAYSLVGRSRNKGNSSYTAESDHRNFLYLEYLKVIAKFQPTVFVMENVKGILSARINGKRIINDILKDLKRPSSRIKSEDGDVEYEIFSLAKDMSDQAKPSDYLIKSEDYGIPQARHRVILLGIRKDQLENSKPGILHKSEANRVTVKDVISDLPALRSGLSKKADSYENWLVSIITGSETLKADLEGSGQLKAIKQIDYSISKISKHKLSRGNNWAVKTRKRCSEKLSNWYQDPLHKGLVCNHETRGHIESDLIRYLFCSTYGLLENAPPKAGAFPESLAPNHQNWRSGKFADRFRVQLADKYATTITSHISKDGHYYIHYDPSQCRSFTVREAARIQTFPDNYFFVGTRTEQYVQVGNAVPPYLAYQIAKIVAGVI